MELYQSILPPQAYSAVKPELWMREIDKNRGKFADFTPHEAKLELVRGAKQWSNYGTTMFKLSNAVNTRVAFMAFH